MELSVGKGEVTGKDWDGVDCRRRRGAERIVTSRTSYSVGSRSSWSSDIPSWRAFSRSRFGSGGLGGELARSGRQYPVAEVLVGAGYWNRATML